MANSDTMSELLEWQADKIESVLSLHHMPAKVTGGTVTPRMIVFQLLPETGAKISKIKGLHEEFAIALGAENCRVARRGATVDVEVPRNNPIPVRLLPMHDQLYEDDSTPAITAILGIAEDGTPLLIRLPSPDVAHILIAGTTGSGKTVLMQSMITSLAMTNSAPSLFAPLHLLGMVMIDLKAHPLTCFDGLPHLARSIVTSVPEAIEALNSLTRLMDNIGVHVSGDPYVALFIDELADLVMLGGDKIIQPLTRLTQRGREAGIHVIAATQKPTASVLGPLMKANFPVRLVGRVTSASEACTATGWSGTGAERLMGRGDFLAIAEGRVLRFQSAHITQDEIRSVTEKLIREQGQGPKRKEHKRDQIAVPQHRIEILPQAPPEVDEMTTMVEKLAPWWKEHKDEWGAKSRAVRVLFGDDAPAAGTFWDKTIAVIAMIEDSTPTSTE